MHMITDDEPSVHLIALYRRLSALPYRILYVGLDLTLLKYLEERLAECWIVRAPAGCVGRIFIEHLEYSLLLFDAELMDGMGQALAEFTRGLAHRQETPIIIVKKVQSLELLAKTIKRLLASQELGRAWRFD